MKSTAIVFFFIFCTSAAAHPAFELVTRLEHDKINESSGLAVSLINDGVLWTMNDDGDPRLFAFDESGSHRGRLTIDPAENRDWEDLASFMLDGKAYLLAADVGDNMARRKSVTIYVVEEPDLTKDRKVRSKPAWSFDISFPDGPQDVEAVAVDAASSTLLLLTKRTIPAVLYTAPLRPDAKSVLASREGTVNSLPRPSQRDIAMAKRLNDWHWQPAAMDIRGRHAVITTYRATYVYERHDNEPWIETLNRLPARIPLGGIRDVEAVAISLDARAIYATTEGEAPPLLRSEFPWFSVSIMAYNVENLFDTDDDAGKDDKTFLPASVKQSAAHKAECETIEVPRWRTDCLEWDWNPDLLETKLARVADAILQVDGGHGPDILALQEIENLSILERLRTEYLAPAGYRPAILIEGQDLRGIDVAFLTRLPLHAPAALHPLQFPDSVPEERERDARGVLEATFVLPGGELLTGFSVHFPAPFHPTELRRHAYTHLNASLAALPSDRASFAGGDFNTTSAEDSEIGLLAEFVEPLWKIAHREGETGFPGTSYFAPRDDWSFLDMLLYRAPENAEWKLDPDSVTIPAEANEQTMTRDGETIPKRFAVDGGISDHLPILMRLRRDR